MRGRAQTCIAANNPVFRGVVGTIRWQGNRHAASCGLELLLVVVAAAAAAAL